MKVYNFGSLNIDLVYEVDNIVRVHETKSSKSLNKFVGGKGLNQSIALAKAGLEVVHLGCVGKDGDVLLNTLNAEKVDTTHIKVVDGASGHAIIQLDERGNNCILLYQGANFEVSKAYIDEMFELINENDLIHLQNEISNIDYIIEKAYRLNIKVAVNLSPINEFVKKIDLNKVTYLLINEVEGKAITGLDDYKEIGDYLLREYPGLNVVLTLGSEGVMFFNKDETIAQHAYKSNVVDTTGAGDTFTGYFLSMILSGKTVKQALQIGCYAGSLAIQVKGAANSIPSLDKVINQFSK